MVTVGGDGVVYVDADLAIRNTAVICDTALELQRQFNADWFGVETNQFQQLLADELIRLSSERAIPIPLCEIDNRVNKMVRIRRLTPLLAQRQIRFKGDSPGARLLVEQMRDFPNGDHDDGPDALEMAVRLAIELLSWDDDLVEERFIAG